MRTQFLLNAVLAATAAASPVVKNRAVTTVTVSGATATTYPQPAVEIQGFPIHQSCNGTERAQLEKALGDTIKIAQQATKHIYIHGNESELFNKYFGVAPTAEVIGWYEKLIYGDHEGVLFRCDDIDGNCHQEGKLFRPSTLVFATILTLISSQVGAATGAARTLLMRQSSALSPTPHAFPSKPCAVMATQSPTAN
jgi:hypothetical protein